tara:strand:- start:1224 stop:1655 length:432 start_codon:yes stop_codon:yes gene_type:complete
MKYDVSQAIPGEKIAITTDTFTEPFWQAAKEERLTACHCADCDTFRMPPTAYCPNCQSQNTDWPTLPGTGTVFSFAICTRSPYPDVPDFTYVPAVIDLTGAPGARLVSNIVGLPAGDVEIGMKVKVDWNPIQDGWKLPIFRKA